MSTPFLKPQWRSEGGKLRCSWCLAETNTPPVAGESHTICERHRDELLETARCDAHQGKRPDQVEFSATVFFFSMAVAFVVVVGVWLWRVLR